MIETEHIWPAASTLPELSIHGGRCEHINARAPWCLHRPERRGQFHLYWVRDGHCRLTTAGEPPRSLHAGDVVLLPGKHAHRLIDQGENTQLLYAQLAGAGAVIGLPPATRINISDSQVPECLPHTLGLIVSELVGNAEDCVPITARLLELLAMYLLRAALRQSNGQPPLRHGHAEDQVGKALELMRTQPEQPWTLSSLAAAVAMSRTAFAAHFRRTVGQPPMHFLAMERMRLAARWIREGNGKLGQIAERLDYQSEAAFQRAFKRHMGLTPGAVRRRSR